MPLSVAIYVNKGHRRSEMVTAAMAEGIRAAGDMATVLDQTRYTKPVAPIAVLYGLVGMLPRIMHDYCQEGRKAVFIDLGYWGRRDGYHKVTVNSRHPTEYFQRVKHPGDRARIFHHRLRPWGEGRRILVAGMGAKGANYLGHGADSWERETIAQIKEYTDRRIVYRPKPSWETAVPIEGTDYCSPAESLEYAFADCHAVVAHHSNTTVDALIAGIPVFVWDGVSKPMGQQDLSMIDAAYRPAGRQQWIDDIAYCQWNVREMTQGMPWRHLKNEGLIP
jgi:hypothetical protein